MNAPTVKIVEITPEMAAQMLKGHVSRELDESRIRDGAKRCEAALKDGLYGFNRMPIVIG